MWMKRYLIAATVGLSLGAGGALATQQMEKAEREAVAAQELELAELAQMEGLELTEVEMEAVTAAAKKKAKKGGKKKKKKAGPGVVTGNNPIFTPHPNNVLNPGTINRP
jgi:hypothetical protein